MPEDELTVLLVNARHVKKFPDARLGMSAIAPGSHNCSSMVCYGEFVPPAPLRELPI